MKIEKIEKYKKILAEKLTENRYNHSLCVADEAVRYAEKYGADTEKAYIAGLLHDITKDSMQFEHFNIFSSHGIALDEISLDSEKLWHAISGAAYIKYELGIDDEEIIDAVRYHTTAKKEMPLLTKILYLADFTSADRNYDDVELLRKLADISLDKAYFYALSYSIKELVEKEKLIHPDTVAAYNIESLKVRLI